MSKFGNNHKNSENKKIKTFVGEVDGNEKDTIQTDKEPAKLVNSSEEVSSEDEDGKYATPEIDSQFMKVLALIKTKDQRIYSDKLNLYEKQQLGGAMERWEKINKKDKEENNNQEITEDDFFEEKKKTTKEIEKEKEEYKMFLVNEIKNFDNKENSLNNWIEENLSLNDKNNKDAFLIDYIVNKKWVQTTKDLKQTSKKLVEDDEMSEDESNDDADANKILKKTGDQAGVTAAKYVSQIRKKKVSKRKRYRDRVKKRKEENIELENIEEMLEKLRKITNNSNIDISDFDKNGKFDFKKHNSRVGEVVEEYKFKNKDLKRAYSTKETPKKINVEVAQLVAELQPLLKNYFERSEMHSTLINT